MIPSIVLAAGDIILNNQPTYAVPPGSVKVLILDLTLPEKLNSIKILNLGDARQSDISVLSIFEDGVSPGWDGDETEIVRRSSSPFWDDEISANSSQLRIFITVDIASTAISGRTIKPKATINSTKTITGFERMILAGTSEPQVPSTPLAEKGQAISTSTIRWYFKDLAGNEFGFKIKDSSLKTVAKIEQSDVSYIDEMGLNANTCYSGRRVSAYNDRGESPSSVNFAEICTLASTPTPTPTSIATPILTPTPTPTVAEVSEADRLKVQIAEIQQKIIDLLTQLIQLIQEQLKAAQASLFNAFGIFTNWLESRF